MPFSWYRVYTKYQTISRGDNAGKRGYILEVRQTIGIYMMFKIDTESYKYMYCISNYILYYISAIFVV